MATFFETPVDDAVNAITVDLRVDDHDDIIVLAVSVAADSTVARLTMTEALALIASLTEAIGTALLNQDE